MENKFRIIDQVTGEIYHSDDEGVQLIFEKGGWSLWVICGLITNQDEGLLFRYTGLKDKHGDEIWEGDIVKKPYYSDRRKINGEIKFIDGEFVTDFIDYDQSLRMATDIEVIGNIYEHSHLLDDAP